ncbi:putative 5'/3'-nucleotidase SurE [Acinetobacter sp. WC-323]|uniref:5'/3'-nucleotidase SurE n=1 Tax=Acinetobacter sp. WC-323 TaxID=903918 RepID=UPI00029E0B57|nr:5'/3'-nucleotidase SurE [Acinetobacter sp. WC-323]EKU51514.1 putative 5'/3'-nucleotidase SurE [Acinetobacter sp. WC-323]
MKKHFWGGLILAGCSMQTFALNILIVNDDGLTSNVKALYDELKSNGHSVLVSVPCSPQSGRGGAIVMYSASVISADNDKQIAAENGCHNGAVAIGAPAAGPFSKAGYNNGDWNYVHGTPVMATAYGLDVVANKRWGKAPDLVLSGPNEGQNVGRVVVHSGTIGNVQFSAARGIPSIALSADSNTVDDKTLNNANSVIVAKQTVILLKELQNKAGQGALLPKGITLNVNFPKNLSNSTPFAFSKIGSYDLYNFNFKVSKDDKGASQYGLGFGINSSAPTAAQATDESAVVQSKIAVTAMQVAYDHRPAAQQWLKIRLKNLFK